MRGRDGNVFFSLEFWEFCKGISIFIIDIHLPTLDIYLDQTWSDEPNMGETTVSTLRTDTDVWYTVHTHMVHGTYLKWHRMKMDSAIERKDKV